MTRHDCSPLPAALPLPPRVDLDRAAQWDYRPDEQALFTDALVWRRAQGIVPATAASFDLHLLVIDAQKDFCFPEGALYVGGRSGRGAVEDNKRLSSWIYRHLVAVNTMTTTLDTHLPYQIFFAPFWVDGDGQPLHAHTVLTTSDVVEGRALPNPDLAWQFHGGDYEWLKRQCAFYCASLEKGGLYDLYLWPPHCLLGSDGHALAGVIHEAHLFHAYTRGAQAWTEIKGDNPLTENYSILRPEVLDTFDGGVLAHKNTRFIERLLAADAIVVAGQASSHCVRSSVDDLRREIEARDPALAAKVYLLADCMSAVTVPDGQGGFLADFTVQAAEAEERFAAAGMHVVRSTDPLESWPGLAERWRRHTAKTAYAER